MELKNNTKINRTPHRKGLRGWRNPGGLFYTVVLAVVVWSAAAQAQSVRALEQRYAEIQQQILAEQAQLDSLKSILDQQTGQIERKKQEDAADKSELRKMMAAGLTITEQINRQQKTVADLQAQLARVRLQLAQRYSARIDSLRRLEKSRTFAPKEPPTGDQAALRREIIVNTEKYMRFSPAFRALSFDPHTISRLDPAAASDSLERAIITEYLQNAARDVNAHLDNIRKNRQELQDIVRLEHKTREFLEEVESDRPGLLAGGEFRAVAENPAGNTGLTHDDLPTRTATQSLQSYETLSLFIEQLDLHNFARSQDSWKFAVDSARVFVSLDEYLEILKAAEQRLQEYQALISQKLESGDPQP